MRVNKVKQKKIQMFTLNTKHTSSYLLTYFSDISVFSFPYVYEAFLINQTPWIIFCTLITSGIVVHRLVVDYILLLRHVGTDTVWATNYVHRCFTAVYNT